MGVGFQSPDLGRMTLAAALAFAAVAFGIGAMLGWRLAL
jgi:hypothetical protein